MIRLPPDFKEFLALLNAHNVHYLVVGGYAVGMHGYPRATGDLDICFASGPQSADTMSVSPIEPDLSLGAGSPQEMRLL